MKSIPHVEHPKWTPEQALTAFCLVFMFLILSVYLLQLLVDKARADVQAAKAQTRIADALDRAYPETASWTHTKLPAPSMLSKPKLCDDGGQMICGATLPTLGGTAR